MGYRVRKRTSSRQVSRLQRHRRVRSKLTGTSERPRLAVFRSQKHISVQVIDDGVGHVLLQSSTSNKELKVKKGNDISAATKVGSDIAKKAIAKKIKKVVFDSAGYRYHGRVKAVAEAARKGGLVF